MSKKALATAIILSGLLTTNVTLAHPGRTDSRGCHTCRTNCSKWGLSSGEYHCHRSKGLEQPKEPVKSKYSETGGYTVPAPEYKNNTASNPISIKKDSSVRDLKEGMKGDDVLALQKKLQSLGFLPKDHIPTSYFGKVTKEAVIKFQKQSKISPASGVVGEKTRSILR